LEAGFGDFLVGSLVDLIQFFGQDLLGVFFGRAAPELFPLTLYGDDGVIYFPFFLDAAFHGQPLLFWWPFYNN
jgi:nitric oxide reductase large subunit